MPGGRTRLDRMRATLRREAEIIGNLAAQLDEDLEAAVDMLLETRGHVLVGGAGTSNAISRRFAHLLCCCGVPATFISAADCLHGASGVVTTADTVVLISKGGRTAEVNECARIVRQRGGRLVAFTGSALNQSWVCLPMRLLWLVFPLKATPSAWSQPPARWRSRPCRTRFVKRCCSRKDTHARSSQ